MPHGHDAEHPRMHVQQHVAVKRPVADCVGGQVERDLAARQDVDGMLARMMAGIAVHHLEEMAVQMDRMRHHRVVDQVDANPLIMAEGNWFGLLAELLAVDRPHIAFHIGGQVDVDFARRRALVGIGFKRLEAWLGQHPVRDFLQTGWPLAIAVHRHRRKAGDARPHLDLRRD